MVLGKSRGLAESNVLIVWPNGPGSLGPKLKSFLQRHRRGKLACFTFIGHPVPLPTALFRESEFVFYSGQGSPRRTVLPRRGYIGLPSLVMDWILTVLFLVRARRRYDVCIALSMHLILLGILLRSLRVVKQVVGVIEEYRPERYSLPLLGRLYRWVTSWCCIQSDFLVFTSSMVPEVLIRDGIRAESAKQITIPQPVDPSDIGSLSLEQLEPDSVVWIGQMTADYGFELVIEAIDQVAKDRPNVVVNIASYAALPDHLWKMIQKRGLVKHFRPLGYIKDEADLRDIIRKNRVALALYHPSATSKRSADVFRPWMYMANGVPQIITRVPPVAAEIEKAGAGIVIDYTKEALADAIVALLTDDQLHYRCRQKGLELVYSRTTGPVLTELLARLGMPADGHAEFGLPDPKMNST